MVDDREPNLMNPQNRDEQYLNDLTSGGEFVLVNEKPLLDDELQDFLVDLFISKHKDQTTIITFMGAPGSGKGVQVQELVKDLEKKGYSSDAISTDGFGMYSRKDRNEKIAAGLKPLDAKDFELNRRIIEAVRRGEAVKAPVYNETTGDGVAAPEEDWHQIGANLQFLIEDGDCPLVEDPDVSIYFHVPTDIRRENRVQRDLVSRPGYGDEGDIRASFDSRLESQYYVYTLPMAERSDILIMTKAIKAEDYKFPYKYSYQIFRHKEE